MKPDRVEPVPVPEDFRHELARCTFADAYRRITARQPTARAAAQAVFGAPPPVWVRGLMGARHAIVRHLGLKVDDLSHGGGPGRIGPFPVLRESAQRVVLGLDDKHLDFRIVVQAAPGAAPGTTAVVVSTLVAEHNALGRGYLAVVKPFHRLLSRRMLARAVL